MELIDTHKQLEANYKKGLESWGKDQNLISQIIQYTDLVPHISILEIGPGKGYLSKELTSLSQHVTGIDVSATAIQHAKKNAPNAHFMNIAFEDLVVKRKYDLIICSEVLYYMKHRKDTLTKLKRSGNYLITSNYIFEDFNIGFGSIIYEILLRRFLLLRMNLKFSRYPFGLEIISLWKLN